MEKLSEKMESQQVALNHIMDRLEVMESVREVHISEPEPDVWRDESITPFHPQEEDVVYLVNKTDHTPPSVSPRVASPRQAPVSPPLPPRNPRPLDAVADAALAVEAPVVEPKAPVVEPKAVAIAAPVVQAAIAIIVDPLSDEEHEIEEEEEEQPPHEDEPDIEEEEEEVAPVVEVKAPVVEVKAPVVEVKAPVVVEEEVVEEEVVEEEVVEEEVVEEEVVEEEVVEEEVVEEEVVEEEEEEGEELEELVYQGVTYYKDADGFLYIMEESGELSETAIGYWKEKTQTVAFYRKK